LYKLKIITQPSPKVLSEILGVQPNWSNFQKKMPMKKALRETQTLHSGCSKAEPKMFTLPQIPFPGTQDCQNLISCRWSLPLTTNRVWSGLMHAISSYRDNRPTHNKHTHPSTHTHTHRQDRLQYTALQLARSVMKEQPKYHIKALCRLRVVRIDPIHFLDRCRTRRLNQALSVLSLSLGFF